MALPDFFLIGAPKAGTTALHAALTGHPRLFLPSAKEPKFYLCAGGPPSRSAHRGPGDAHSAREWIWRRDEYEALFDPAPPGTLRGESTPFYLYDRDAHRRIRDEIPHARLIAVLRDPVERAYSNWMHLWSDGLEPEADFVRAFHAEDARRRAGWAPFWRYRGLGLYGEHLEHLYSLFPREQVHLLRYRDLVDDPGETVAAACDFLGVPVNAVAPPPVENVRPLVPITDRTRRFARALRVGAWTGQFFPPHLWRRASRPLLRRLHATGAGRPGLSEAARGEILPSFVDDIRLLERVTGASYADWLSPTGKGSFASRRAVTEPPVR